MKEQNKLLSKRLFYQSAIFLSLGLAPMLPSQLHAAEPTALVQDQQEITITGKIVDQSNQPIGGVSIKSGGKTLGASNQDGTFTVQTSQNTPVIFESIGFLPVRRTFQSNQENVTVRLQEAATEINEVIVTALGIERSEKALGYSTTTVSGEDLTDAISNNWTDALSGKVAGLNLTKSGGGPAGSNEIILRGEASLTGSNSALIVVDGVVVSGSSGQMTGTGSGNYLSEESPVDFGTGIAELNPDDIESVSVLKGPGAAALYGSRGANGAIIITTKSGTSQKGLGISVNSNTSIGTINRWPDYQYEYGQGVGGGDLYYSYGQTEDGPSTLSSSAAWGPKFDGQMYYQYNPEYYREAPPERTLWQPYKNNRKDFFEPEATYTNNVSLSGGTDKTRLRLSYTNATNKWFIPNMGYSRNNISLTVDHKINDKLSISAKTNYRHRKSDNLPNTGYNNQAVMYFIRGITPNMDLNWFKPYWRPGMEHIEQTTPFSNLLDNPYFQSNEVINAQKRNGFIGSVQANYQFNDLFAVQVRTSMDFQYDERMQRRPFDTYKFPQGYYREYNIYTQETNSDILLSYTNNRHEDFKHGVKLGGSLMQNKYIKDDLRTKKLIYPGVYNFANSAEILTNSPLRRMYAVNSIYAMADFSYRDLIFVDATMRTDWASTLASPIKNEVTPFFYPSLNTSFILSQMFELPREFDMLKLRASVAGVGGGGTVPYRTAYTYGIADNFQSGLLNPTTIPNLDLKPERTTSYELGLDMRLFKHRATLDLTVYNSNSRDQIITAPIEPSSGFTHQVMNAGEIRNRGIEVEWSGTPIKKADGVTWRLYGTASANEGKIISVPNEERQITLSTVFGSRGAIDAREGGMYGDMYGFGYVRNEAGEIVYENGLPLLSEELLYIGNVNPTFRSALGTEVSYKNFRFNILFDGQWGGVGYSLTHAVLMEEGKLNKSIPGRYNGIIGNGVVLNPDGTYSPNTQLTDARSYYYTHFHRDNLESNTFSTDYIKLREMRIDYTIPSEITDRWNIQRAVIGLYGRDLFVFSNWPSFDPEFGSLTGDGIQKGAEIAQFPSTRTFGLNLSFAF